MKLGTELDDGRNTTSNPGVARIRVATDSDILVARRAGRDLAVAAGFTGTVTFSPAVPPQYRIAWQSLTAGTTVTCSHGITVSDKVP